MTRHQERLKWMRAWARRNGVTLNLRGEVGFANSCVGVEAHGRFLDYMWYNRDMDRRDPNGKVWTPDLAYQKHPCVAVLGWGPESEAQLYKWLRWFERRGFTVDLGPRSQDTRPDVLEIITGSRIQPKLILSKSGRRGAKKPGKTKVKDTL